LNAPVENMQNELFDAFLEAVKLRTMQIVGRFILAPTADGGVAVRLPSGRNLIYSAVRISENVPAICTVIRNDGEIGEVRFQFRKVSYGDENELYAAKLFEHIVQAIGRDLLATMIIRAEQHGIRIACHIHDELIAVVPDRELAEKRKFLEDGNSLLPEWAKGLTMPLKITVGTDFSQL